jgi:hypothetical protein
VYVNPGSSLAVSSRTGTSSPQVNSSRARRRKRTPCPWDCGERAGAPRPGRRRLRSVRSSMRPPCSAGRSRSVPAGIMVVMVPPLGSVAGSPRPARCPVEISSPRASRGHRAP